MVPSAVIVMAFVAGLIVAEAALAFGRLTLMPWTVAVTTMMKTMRRFHARSSRGTTFSSATHLDIVIGVLSHVLPPYSSSTRFVSSSMKTFMSALMLLISEER